MDFSAYRQWLDTLLGLVRPRNMILAFVGVVTGALLYTGPPLEFWPILCAALTASLILGAGNALNDYFDFESDKINKPERPIPSGRISRSDTLMMSIVLFMAGIGLSKAINDYTLVIATLNALMLIIYARYSKKLFFLANIVVSYLVASIFLFGAVASLKQTPSLGMINPLFTTLIATSFLSTMAREIVKDVEDMPGDEKIYSNTLPIKAGTKRAREIAFLFMFAAVAASLYPLFNPPTGFNLLFYAAMILTADILFLLSFTMHESIAQRLMVAGMFISLTGYTGSILFT
ncbi:MAG: digeranylgeranylglyceryl phosphate synthase [Candidatus Altiarchaeales archaeon]|nr:digeranylgeranylglyceryl phosphate synthase [Candidatus Altiarchaeales archaeon]